jgi:hypothetical protein
LVVSHGASGSHFTPVSDALCGADGAGVDAGGGGGGADEGHGGAGGMKANLVSGVALQATPGSACGLVVPSPGPAGRWFALLMRE